MNLPPGSIVSRWRRGAATGDAPAPKEEVRKLLRQICSPVSEDVLALYSEPDEVFAAGIDNNLLSLWPLAQIQKEHQQIPKPYVPFGDFLLSSHEYCYRYEAPDRSSVHLYMRGGSPEPTQVATSLSEFIRLAEVNPELVGLLPSDA